ncbi:hypothetical protein LOZ53_001399 [Ophidiomyces ophidiicola]|nr:hypothetical protein LOZ53_001399 [Ophidiomyces ophidiicola]
MQLPMPDVMLKIEEEDYATCYRKPLIFFAPKPPLIWVHGGSWVEAREYGYTFDGYCATKRSGFQIYAVLDINIEQQDSFRLLLLPLEPLHERLFSQEDWHISAIHVITVKDVRLERIRSYPSLEYKSRALLIHKRCHNLVEGLSYFQLCILIDVVEPTFNTIYGDTLRTPSTHGAFFLQPTETDKKCIIGQQVAQLPIEIQANIFKHDIARLLFVVRTALQIQNKIEGSISDHRFSEKTLIVHTNVIEIHTVDIGDRTYIGDIACAEPLASTNTLNSQRRYGLGESKYLVVKTDGIGVVDFAFEKTRGRPKWILGNSAAPFHAQTSVIHSTNTSGQWRLRMFRDSLKCRAISLDRIGAEPYFDNLMAPLQDSWTSSGFPLETRLTTIHAPFAYFAHGTYASFVDTKSISFDLEPLRLGIINIRINATSNQSNYNIHLTNLPTAVKFILCGVSLLDHTFQYLFIQFELDSQWKPPFPSILRQLKPPTIVRDVLGIWWAEPFRMVPHHIGVVCPGGKGPQRLWETN